MGGSTYASFSAGLRITTHVSVHTIRICPQQNTQLCTCVCRPSWRSLVGMMNFAFSRLAAVALASVIALSAVFSGVAVAQQRLATPGQKPTIVLVHGAFADASSWSGVIRRLQM